MSSSSMINYGTLYHLNGDISKMNIVVRLEKTNTFGLSGIKDELIDMSGTEFDIPPLSHIDEDVDDVTIQWMEKIHCPRKEGVIGEMNEKRRIFTYVTGDLLPKFITDQELLLSTRELTSRKNSTVDDIVQITKKKKKSPFEVWSRSNPIIDRPLPIERHSLIQCKRSTMYIMGYLGPIQENHVYSEDEDEFVICRITLYDSGTLIVEPRIGEHASTIKLNSAHGNYQVHVRVIEESKEIVEGGERRENYLDEKNIDDEFTLALNDARIPDENTFEMSYRITLDRLIDFPFDGLYIEYSIDIPNNMEVLTDYETFGVTMQSFCKYDDEGHHTISHVDHSFEITIIIHPGSINSLPFIPPRLRLRILSYDSWGRQYVAGYSSLTLPIQPIVNDRLSIDCWRIVNPTDSSATMREFFLGAAFDLTDFFSINYKSPEGRLGVCTESTGTVELIISSSWQSGRYIVDERSLGRVRFGDKMKKIGIDFSLHWRIMKALLEFDEARRELLRVRGISSKELNNQINNNDKS